MEMASDGPMDTIRPLHGRTDGRAVNALSGDGIKRMQPRSRTRKVAHPMICIPQPLITCSHPAVHADSIYICNSTPSTHPYMYDSPAEAAKTEFTNNTDDRNRARSRGDAVVAEKIIMYVWIEGAFVRAFGIR